LTEHTHTTDRLGARTLRWLLLLVLAGLTLASAGCSVLAGGPPKVTVQEAAGNPALVGKRVRVEGVVVPSSWNGHLDPMTFVLVGSEIKGLGSRDLTVSYVARPPAALPPADFGGGTTLVVVGTVMKGGVLRAESVVDKFPPTYTSPPMSVAYLNVRSQQISGGPADLIGFVVPGSLQATTTGSPGVVRFVLEDSPSSGYTLPVRAQLGGPAEAAILASGRRILVTGAAGRDGSFWATRIVRAP
jgi:cytochrome c-type biogenesis protein CcmE